MNRGYTSERTNMIHYRLDLALLSCVQRRRRRRRLLTQSQQDQTDADGLDLISLFPPPGCRGAHFFSPHRCLFSFHRVYCYLPLERLPPKKWKGRRRQHICFSTDDDDDDTKTQDGDISSFHGYTLLQLLKIKCTEGRAGLIRINLSGSDVLILSLVHQATLSRGGLAMVVRPL